MKSWLFGILSAFLLSICSTGVSYASVVDQFFEPDPPTGFATITSSPTTQGIVYRNVAQTFTVGTDGLLTKVDLLVRGLVPFEDLLFELRPTISGVPDTNASSALISGVIPSTTFPITPMPEPIWISVDFSASALPVSSGAEYALVLGLSGPEPAEYEWAGAEGNPYLRGNGYYQNDSDPWNELIDSFTATNIDLGFRTYVVPIPPALYLFGTGLLGLIGVARKKAA